MFCKKIFWLTNALCMIIALLMALLCAIFMDSIHNVHLVYCILGFLVSIVTFVLTAVGCRALNPESTTLMWIYIPLMAIALAVQVYITTHFHAHGIIEQMLNEVKVLWSKELKHVGAMASMEMEFKCCGLHGFHDYLDAKLTIPDSCKDYDSPLVVYFSDGCLKKVEFVVSRGTLGLCIMSTILTVVQFLALLFGSTTAFICQRQANYDSL